MKGSILAKVYQKGSYVDIDPYSFEYPHENLAYMVNGRRYKFVLCHWDYDKNLRGYNTHTKCWWNLYSNYVQKDGCMPINADLVMGNY